MKRKPVLYLGATSLALVIEGGVGLMVSERSVSAYRRRPVGRGRKTGRRRSARRLPLPRRQTSAAPTYRNVPLWPKPLPNFWVFGSISGVAVDKERPRVDRASRRGDA